MIANQRFVYVIESTTHPGRVYTGLTSDVRSRLAAHNAGEAGGYRQRVPL